MQHLPPHLQRRTFLRLGLGAATVLAVAGGVVALVQPGLVNGKLSPSARVLVSKVAQAILLGTLPPPGAAQEHALAALLTRCDQFIAGLPDPVQAELSQLLGLLGTTIGRRTLIGLTATWEEAQVTDITTALTEMRASSTSLRILAYQGLHDIVCAPYFSGEESWLVLGYPGPSVI